MARDYTTTPIAKQRLKRISEIGENRNLRNAYRLRQSTVSDDLGREDGQPFIDKPLLRQRTGEFQSALAQHMQKAPVTKIPKHRLQIRNAHNRSPFPIPHSPFPIPHSHLKDERAIPRSIREDL